MLSKVEERFVKSPTSFMVRKGAYTKKQLEKRIKKTAKDIGLLIDNGYDISEIVDSIVRHSDGKIKRAMEHIIIIQKILNEKSKTEHKTKKPTHEKSKTETEENPDEKSSDEKKWDLG